MATRYVQTHFVCRRIETRSLVVDNVACYKLLIIDLVHYAPDQLAMYRAVIVVSQLCGGGGYKLIHYDIQNSC
jgi:hypothetical protein